MRPGCAGTTGQLGLVRHHRPRAADLRRGLRGRAGHHGRRRARPPQQPRAHQRAHHALRCCAAGCTAATAAAGCKASTATRRPYYRCRYPKEYALANHVSHPANVYLREADVLPAIDRWLAAIFAPAPARADHRARCTAAQPAHRRPGPPVADAQAADRRLRRTLARYQAALDAGADPPGRRRVDPPGQSRARRSPRPLTPAQPAAAASSPKTTSGPHRRPRRPARRPRADAEPADKAAIYAAARAQGSPTSPEKQNPGRVTISPETFSRQSTWGNGSCPRGDLNPHALLGH